VIHHRQLYGFSRWTASLAGSIAECFSQELDCALRGFDDQIAAWVDRERMHGMVAGEWKARDDRLGVYSLLFSTPRVQACQ
jgi:hypothetical protein